MSTAKELLEFLDREIELLNTGKRLLRTYAETETQKDMLEEIRNIIQYISYSLDVKEVR